MMLKASPIIAGKNSMYIDYRNRTKVHKRTPIPVILHKLGELIIIVLIIIGSRSTSSYS